jgi:hypothetical protein
MTSFSPSATRFVMCGIFGGVSMRICILCVREIKWFVVTLFLPSFCLRRFL